MNTDDLKNISAAYLEVVTEKNKESNEKHKELMKKKADEDASNDKSDDGEGMDKVDPKAAKKKFADRKDKDVDNDGDVDASDKFLHKRRKAISKAMDKEESKTEDNHEDDADPKKKKKVAEPANDEVKEADHKKKKKLKADDENPADDDSKDDDEVEEGKRGFIAAAKAAKEKGEKEFVFAGKKYAVKEYTATEIDEILGAVAGAARVAKSATSAVGKGAKRVGTAAVDVATKESYSFDELVDMSEEAFDELAERIDRKEMDEIVGTIARGIGRTAKKVVNRFSTSGRADAAQNKLAKMKKKAADKDRLSKAKSDIANLKKKPTVTSEKEPEKKMKKFNEVREAAQTKGATKPEGIMDKESPKSKEFADKHKSETNDTVEKSHKDAAEAGRKGPAGKKRSGDNPKGDKSIVNKPTQKEGVQNGMRKALMQMKGE